MSLVAMRSKPKKARPRGVELTIWGVPRDLRQGFKTACSRKGSTMRQAIITFMERYAKNPPEAKADTVND